jgi:hypothetical protein
MRIRIECGLDSRSRAGFWKNYRAGVLTFFSFKKVARTRCGLDSRIYDISAFICVCAVPCRWKPCRVANSYRRSNTVTLQPTNMGILDPIWCVVPHKLRGHQLWSHSILSQHFVGPEGSLPNSQQSPPVLILSQNNPIHTTPSHLSKIHLNVIHRDQCMNVAEVYTRALKLWSAVFTNFNNITIHCRWSANHFALHREHPTQPPHSIHFGRRPRA